MLSSLRSSLQRLIATSILQSRLGDQCTPQSFAAQKPDVDRVKSHSFWQTSLAMYSIAPAATSPPSASSLHAEFRVSAFLASMKIQRREWQDTGRMNSDFD
jgi:hypothetical protein